MEGIDELITTSALSIIAKVAIICDLMLKRYICHGYLDLTDGYRYIDRYSCIIRVYNQLPVAVISAPANSRAAFSEMNFWTAHNVH